MKYPTEAELKSILDKVRTEDLQPYIDKVSNEPLLKEKPQPGKIVKKEEGAFGTTILTLSNNVRVIVKPTDFKADEVQMAAFSPGGTSLFDDKDALQFKVINEVASLGGLGNFKQTDLNKVLAGKWHLPRLPSVLILKDSAEVVLQRTLKRCCSLSTCALLHRALTKKHLLHTSAARKLPWPIKKQTQEVHLSIQSM